MSASIPDPSNKTEGVEMPERTTVKDENSSSDDDDVKIILVVPKEVKQNSELDSYLEHLFRNTPASESVASSFSNLDLTTVAPETLSTPTIQPTATSAIPSETGSSCMDANVVCSICGKVGPPIPFFLKKHLKKEHDIGNEILSIFKPISTASTAIDLQASKN